MKDNDQQLIFETYLNELRASEMSSPLKDTDPETGKPVDCVRTEHDPKTGKKTQMKCLPKEEGMGQPDDFTGAEPDHLHDPADDGSHRNDFLRMKVSKAVKDIDNADFIKEVIETIWAMREEAGILPPDEIPHDMMDDETHDEPRGLSDQEKWG